MRADRIDLILAAYLLVGGFEFIAARFSAVNRLPVFFDSSIRAAFKFPVRCSRNILTFI